ncbi:MAG: N-acetyltransferase [Rhodospirillaceae bacterium]
MQIIAEPPDHAGAIEALLDQAFGGGRAAKTVYRLRDGVAPIADLCFAAVEDGEVQGTIRYWPVTIGGALPALLLGPIAVAGPRRCEGLGAVLIDHSLARAAALGHRIVLLVGDAPYYGRFGFRRALTLGLSLPGPVDLERFLGLDLVPGALDGVVGAVGRWPGGQ